MISQAVAKPGNVKAEIERPGTRTVARYKVTTLVTHRKSPSVMRLNGRRKILRSGFRNVFATAKAEAPKIKFLNSLLKLMPPIFWLINQMAKA